MDSNISSIKDQTDDKINPSSPTKPKGFSVSDSEQNFPSQSTTTPLEGAPSTKEAPTLISESQFQNRIPESGEFSVSPQKYDIPYKHWEPTREELNFYWKELQDQPSDRKKNIWRKKENKIIMCWN